MLIKILKSFKGLSKVVSNYIGGFANLAVMVVICLAVGYLSHFFLGDDNPIEQSMENVVDTSVEKEFHLPLNTINVDLSPKDEHTKKA
jgi:hypothetical protein